MRVGVTGASGFLGGYICKHLTEKGHDVRAMVRQTSDTSFVATLGVEIVVGDLDDTDGFDAFVDGCGCVVQNAVDFGACRSDQPANFRRNVLASLMCLELCRTHDAQFIFISTGAVHDRILDDRPLDEAHPLWPGSTYGAYKAAVEAFLPAYRTQFGTNGSAYRPTSIYGVHPTDPRRSQWYALVEQVVHATKPFHSSSGGKIVHVDDVAEVVARAVGREDVAGEVYELTDCHIYDNAIATFAAEAAGLDLEIAPEPGSGPKHQIVSDKARNTFDVGIDRGHAGVRAYVTKLVEIIRSP